MFRNDTKPCYSFSLKIGKLIFYVFVIFENPASNVILKKNIIGYLQDFLFSPDRTRTPVKVLSGGERNRLFLARLFAKPSNLIVMDEPTNDLDVETLELLEELLVEYRGTVLLVSHDRSFLNNVVTSTLAMEGDGRVREYPGDSMKGPPA
ncbi:MAG: ATP-binding cassette domain-containing protein [Bacteroidia bacterium]|nr:ATP-binding cassette domain-containing protein [Bacteroidia bacterium]